MSNYSKFHVQNTYALKSSPSINQEARELFKNPKVADPETVEVRIRAKVVRGVALAVSFAQTS